MAIEVRPALLQQDNDPAGDGMARRNPVPQESGNRVDFSPGIAPRRDDGPKGGWRSWTERRRFPRSRHRSQGNSVFGQQPLMELANYG